MKMEEELKTEEVDIDDCMFCDVDDRLFCDLGGAPRDDGAPPGAKTPCCRRSQRLSILANCVCKEPESEPCFWSHRTVSRQGGLHVFKFFSSCRHTVRAARQGGFASAQCAITSDPTSAGKKLRQRTINHRRGTSGAHSPGSHARATL